MVLHCGAAEAAERQRLDIPGGRLGDALVALGRQANVNVGVSDAQLASERVDRLTGTYTVHEALRRLLRKSTGRYVAIDAVTFQIVRRAPAKTVQQTVRRPRAARPSRPASASREETEEEIVVTAAKRPILFADFPGTADILQGDDYTPDGGLRGSDALVARLPSLTSTHLGARPEPAVHSRHC